MIKNFCDKCRKEKDEENLNAWEKGDYIKCRDFPNGGLDLCGKCFNELVEFLGIITKSRKFKK